MMTDDAKRAEVLKIRDELLVRAEMLAEFSTLINRNGRYVTGKLREVEAILADLAPATGTRGEPEEGGTPAWVTQIEELVAKHQVPGPLPPSEPMGAEPKTPCSHEGQVNPGTIGTCTVCSGETFAVRLMGPSTLGVFCVNAKVPPHDGSPHIVIHAGG